MYTFDGGLPENQNIKMVSSPPENVSTLPTENKVANRIARYFYVTEGPKNVDFAVGESMKIETAISCCNNADLKKKRMSCMESES